MTYAELIINLLAQQPGLDDDQLARQLGIEPRQTVNQLCRRLEVQGLLVRERGPAGKIGDKKEAGIALSRSSHFDGYTHIAGATLKM